ncbi:MAG TPA: hypothetical protein ENN19_14490 [Chloroflexi bacterium]|nr:hypothetical protein [Chloroflexota bacterium]
MDGQYRETMREIERMALMLQQMAEALVKTADLIEEADREAAGLFSLEEAQTGFCSYSPALRRPSRHQNRRKNRHTSNRPCTHRGRIPRRSS